MPRIAMNQAFVWLTVIWLQDQFGRPPLIYCNQCVVTSLALTLSLPRPGVEGICAGMFLPATPCLVHGKVLKTHLDVWVKTSSSLLTDSIAKLAESVFKN